MKTSAWVVYFCVGAAWLLYVVLGLMASSGAASGSLKVSPVVAQLLRMTVYLPFLISWLAAAAGWFNLRRFARELRGSKQLEQPAFAAISRGFGLLMFGLVSTSLLSTARPFLMSNPGGLRLVVVIGNYLGVFLSLWGFAAIYRGTGRLTTRSTQYTALNREWALLVPIAIFGVLFAGLIYTNPARQSSLTPGQPASYYLADWMILVSIILPAVASWYLGLQSALRLQKYLYRSSPSWPRQALANLFNGLLAVVTGSILTHALVAMGPRLASYGLVLVLLLIYLFLAIQAIGYGLIALGAKRLLNFNHLKP